MSWFKKFIGDARRPGDLSDNDRATIRQDLAPLDKIRPGLADETARYVIDGENSTVMLFLTQERAKVASALLNRPWPELFEGRQSQSHYILCADEWRPDIVWRYGQVLGVAHSTGHYYPVLGSALTPDWFRAILKEYADGCRAVQQAKRQSVSLSDRELVSLTVEKLQSLLAQDENPSLVPIFDMAFDRQGRRWFGNEEKRGQKTYRKKGVRRLIELIILVCVGWWWVLT